MKAAVMVETLSSALGSQASVAYSARPDIVRKRLGKTCVFYAKFLDFKKKLTPFDPFVVLCRKYSYVVFFHSQLEI